MDWRCFEGVASGNTLILMCLVMRLQKTWAELWKTIGYDENSFGEA